MYKYVVEAKELPNIRITMARNLIYVYIELVTHTLIVKYSSIVERVFFSCFQICSLRN